MISARGTGEPLNGNSLLGAVATRIAAGEPGRTRHVDVPYPADATGLSITPGDSYFGESADEGVRLMVDELNAAAQACPGQKSVVSGFSQGALVAGDVLLPPSRRNAGREVAALSEQASRNVVAVLLYGDPRFVGGEPYNAGSYDQTLDGFMTPRSAGALDAYDGRVRDYCVARDFVCQRGGQFDPHLEYFSNGMIDDGASFALDLMRQGSATG
ncbi:cutinase family protein [Kineosporia succinea]